MARLILQGRPGSPGAGLGRLARVSPTALASAPPHPIRVEASQRGPEQERLRDALELASTELTHLADATRTRAGADTAAIFEAQALLATDPALVDDALAAIANDGLAAAEAIELAASRHAAVLEALEDEYIRARAADIRDVSKRVAAILRGVDRSAIQARAGEPAVLAAEDLDASMVAELRPELVAGVALDRGARTGHAAIVARALGIPLVLGLGEALLRINDGEEVIADGTLGRLLVGPDARERCAVAANGTVRGTSSIVELAPLTLPVLIEANAGSAREVEQAASAGAHGIGLLRTELLFLGRTVAPGLDEQRALYRRIRLAMPHGPVVFRTLDVGGDKPVGYRHAPVEANPALGVRGVRLGLRDPDLLEVQLRALLECAPELPLHVMFPMVATVEELREARAALVRARSSSRGAGFEVATEVHVGIMIEVPAAAVLADMLAPEVDFFSVGTNDLIQYTMAADRTSADLADLGTAVQPAVLRLIAQVCRAARQYDRPVAVCGEAAADPLVAPVLVGLGVNRLSVASNSVSHVHQALHGLTLEACQAAAEASLRVGTSAEVLEIMHRLRSTPSTPVAQVPLH